MLLAVKHVSACSVSNVRLRKPCVMMVRADNYDSMINFRLKNLVFVIKDLYIHKEYVTCILACPEKCGRQDGYYLF